MITRRHFVGAAECIVAGMYAVPGAAADDTEAIKRAVERYYAAYRGLDRAKYRAV